MVGEWICRAEANLSEQIEDSASMVNKISKYSKQTKYSKISKHSSHSKRSSNSKYTNPAAADLETASDRGSPYSRVSSFFEYFTGGAVTAEQTGSRGTTTEAGGCPGKEGSV